MSELLTTRQVAKELGLNIITIYRYIWEGKLKAHKIGGHKIRNHWRIKRVDLEAFINDGKEAERTIA